MNLLEWQGKALLVSHGIAIPPGRVANSPAEAEAVAASLQCPVMVKAQVRAGKRGKAGGVKSAGTPGEARSAAEAILPMQIGGESVEAVLVEKRLSVIQELYAGITISPKERAAVVMVSSEGGMEIEEVALRNPSAVATLQVDGYHPIWPHPFLNLVKQTGVTGRLLPLVANAVHRLVKAAFDLDATLAEINPLVVTAEGEVLAADAKVVIDDAALFRHMEIADGSTLGLSPLEMRARRAKLAYVPLQGGEVGVIAGGAGLALASMDTISAYGRRPTNFLDVGGGVSQESMSEAVRIVAATPGVEGIIINVFGGINNCAVMARGIADALDSENLSVPLVVKMRGHSQEEGWATLESRQVPIVKFGTTGEAVACLLTQMDARKKGVRP